MTEKFTIPEALSYGNKIEEMHYLEYKNNYSENPVIRDSYDPKKKTILVVIPDYEKKLKICETELENLKPKNDPEKMKKYNHHLSIWLSETNEEKIEALKKSEIVYINDGKSIITRKEFKLEGFYHSLNQLKDLLEN